MGGITYFGTCSAETGQLPVISHSPSCTSSHVLLMPSLLSATVPLTYYIGDKLTIPFNVSSSPPTASAITNGSKQCLFIRCHWYMPHLFDVPLSTSFLLNINPLSQWIGEWYDSHTVWSAHIPFHNLKHTGHSQHLDSLRETANVKGDSDVPKCLHPTTSMSLFVLSPPLPSPSCYTNVVWDVINI